MAFSTSSNSLYNFSCFFFKLKEFRVIGNFSIKWIEEFDEELDEELFEIINYNVCNAYYYSLNNENYCIFNAANVIIPTNNNAEMSTGNSNSSVNNSDTTAKTS